MINTIKLKMQTISINEIYLKLRTKEDKINYFREHGTLIYNILYTLGLYYPNISCYNNQFFLDVLCGKKKVSTFDI